METNKKETINSNFKIMIGSVIAIILMLCILIYNGSMLVLEPELRGTFGDTFGLSNAIFSGLAFIGIIVTILLQMDELKEQREELRLTRMEMEEQNYTFKLQRFENTFFQLNAKLTDTINNFKFYEKDMETIGSAVFAILYDKYLSSYHNRLAEGNSYDNLNSESVSFSTFRPSTYFYVYGFEKQVKGMMNHYSQTFLTVSKNDESQPMIASPRIINSPDRMNILSHLNVVSGAEYLDKSYEYYWPKIKPYLSHYYKLFYRIIKHIDEANFVTHSNLKSSGKFG